MINKINTFHTIGSEHDWLKKVSTAFYMVPGNPLLEQVASGLKEKLHDLGHTVMESPKKYLDLLITNSELNQPVSWRKALFFTARRQFGLENNPTLFTLLSITRKVFDALLDRFQKAIQRDPLNPADFDFPGLSPHAYATLYEQGRRAGPIVSLARLLQAQAKSVRILLVVGEKRPELAYTFDLVGAHPCTDASDPEKFYTDLVLRMVTAASTNKVDNHEIIDPVIPKETWQSLDTPGAMRTAGRELGQRSFFTPMVEVGNLVDIPLFNDAIANQYSEGCFATWEPEINALVTTITGSARPVEKGNLTDDEMAVICGVRPNNIGAQIQHVAGKVNDPPSSEAMEIIGMDLRLPTVHLEPKWGIAQEVPVSRSKLHGHRGVHSYDPQLVELVHLDPAYYHYPVSCSTDAQAQAVMDAFARSAALRNPEDPRQIIFCVLPGHGIWLVEKWVANKAPFQVLWEAMDNGLLEINNQLPQGPFRYLPDEQGRMTLLEESY